MNGEDAKEKGEIRKDHTPAIAYPACDQVPDDAASCTHQFGRLMMPRCETIDQTATSMASCQTGRSFTAAQSSNLASVPASISDEKQYRASVTCDLHGDKIAFSAKHAQTETKSRPFFTRSVSRAL